MLDRDFRLRCLQDDPSPKQHEHGRDSPQAESVCKHEVRHSYVLLIAQPSLLMTGRDIVLRDQTESRRHGTPQVVGQEAYRKREDL